MRTNGLTSTNRETSIPNYATILFTILIAAVGAVMMTLTSSSQMRGAAMLWIPAAMQLIAGVWLGPIRGFIAGGLGAYLAGGIAYGGWGIMDIVMNPIAGGFANSLLPSLLFRTFKIDPTFGVSDANLKKALFISISLLIFLLFAGIIPLILPIRQWVAYCFTILIIALIIPIGIKELKQQIRSLLLAEIICVFCCALSALIGSWAIYTFQIHSWRAALLGTGAGWFLGDTVSSFLGIYFLALYTERARNAGVLKN